MGEMECCCGNGIDYYNKMIDDLLANRITPIVTLYHFDLPQTLEDQGGWLSDTIIESFDEYAQFCFKMFGDRVKQWITINEPNMFALLAYDLGAFPPGVPHLGTGGYQAAHNLIKAHARAWHSYDSLFRKEQKGLVSLALFCGWVEPADPNSVSDQEAAKRALAFHLDFFAKPIFIDGDYPEVVKSQIASMSKKQGYPSSRLPEFTEEEKRMIKGTADFFAVQYYSSRLVKYRENDKGERGVLRDVEMDIFPDPAWISVDWVYVVPWGIRKLLKYIKQDVIKVIEDFTGSVEADAWQQEGYKSCSLGIPPGQDAEHRLTLLLSVSVLLPFPLLLPMERAIQLDKVNLQLYCAWSLLDNFEWNQGYSMRFGFFHVDFEDLIRPRVPYTSAKEYAKVIRNNGLEGQL
ncbi:Cytosolic beta-glucosidase [Myotis davidii]|uniref:Cytosolic beta-glucosidase n=1 Tax=Myotis davidii TaxID=225400 RepID=L5LF94_MYODS|nr:Cytosolic beta-glucosidase [Myotis davidii]